MNLWLLSFGIVLVCLKSATALAHPHVWVDYTANINADASGIHNLDLNLTFDSMYSVVVRSEVIMNDTERTVQEQTLKSAEADLLADNPVFIFMSINGKEQEPKKLTLNNSDKNKDNQTYSLTVPLPPQTKYVSFSIYDPTYYVSVGMKDADNALEVTGPAICERDRIDISATVWGMLRADKIDCSLNRQAN